MAEERRASYLRRMQQAAVSSVVPPSVPEWAAIESAWELIKALEKLALCTATIVGYAQHRNGCNVYGPVKRCTCGLDRALLDLDIANDEVKKLHA